MCSPWAWNSGEQEKLTCETDENEARVCQGLVSFSFGQDVSKISTPERIWGSSGQMARTLAEIETGSELRASLWLKGFQGSTRGKESCCQCRDIRDLGLIPGSGRSQGGGHGNPLQYSCLENPLDRGACQATVHKVTKSRTWLNDLVHKVKWGHDFGLPPSRTMKK